jgi:hypothetical protein
MSELDRTDDELFSTDYWPPIQPRHLSLLPEPPTIRLGTHPVRTAVPPRPTDAPTARLRETDPPTVRLRPPDPPSVRLHARPPAAPTSPYTAAENGTEIVALIGLAVLLVVTVAAVAIMLWLWA